MKKMVKDSAIIQVILQTTNTALHCQTENTGWHVPAPPVFNYFVYAVTRAGPHGYNFPTWLSNSDVRSHSRWRTSLQNKSPDCILCFFLSNQFLLLFPFSFFGRAAIWSHFHVLSARPHFIWMQLSLVLFVAKSCSTGVWLYRTPCIVDSLVYISLSFTLLSISNKHRFWNLIIPTLWCNWGHRIGSGIEKSTVIIRKRRKGRKRWEKAEKSRLDFAISLLAKEVIYLVSGGIASSDNSDHKRKLSFFRKF